MSEVTRASVATAVLSACLLLTGCGSDGATPPTAGGGSAATTPRADAPTTAAAAPVWAKQVNGAWQVDVEAFTCPTTADELYEVVAADEFPIVTNRPGTDEHVWPAGDIEDAVACSTDTFALGESVQRMPASDEDPPIVNSYRGGDWPLPSDGTRGTLGYRGGAGAAITLLDYAEGDDVVVHSWWGAESPPSSYAEAFRAPGTTELPVTVSSNGRLVCRVMPRENAEPLRTCDPRAT